MTEGDGVIVSDGVSVGVGVFVGVGAGVFVGFGAVVGVGVGVFIGVGVGVGVFLGGETTVAGVFDEILDGKGVGVIFGIFEVELFAYPTPTIIAKTTKIITTVTINPIPYNLSSFSPASLASRSGPAGRSLSFLSVKRSILKHSILVCMSFFFKCAMLHSWSEGSTRIC